MSNQKISQMTYKQLAADDEFPTVNSSSLANTKALGGDIPLLIGILQWDASAIYTSGQIVIYNGAEVKGMFLVTSTTSAGDAPDGTGYTKFKSLALAFVPNIINVVGNTIVENLGLARTCRIVFPTKTGPNVPDSGTYIFGLTTGYTYNDIKNAKIDCTLSSDIGQNLTVIVRNVTSDGSGGTIIIILEFPFTGITNGNPFNLDIKIEL
jgi:hypothetical protein